MSQIREGAVSLRPPRSRFRHKLLHWLAYALWIGLLCFGGVKLFWWYRFSVPLTHKPDQETVWHAFYPELYTSGVLSTKLDATDGFYDVLLLGGSTLEQTGPMLERSLRRELGSRFRLFNLARAAHTSRDSFRKHSRLVDRHFDLVIAYDGINDARANCCPDDVFRADYTHMAWYRGFERRLEAGRMTFTDIVSRSLSDSQVHGPEDVEWRHFSDHVKTAASFRTNLEPIVKAAENRRCPFVLMTFAYHIPANYSEEAFAARRLDYGRGQHENAISLWGTPAGVKRAIDAHNGVIREVAGRYKNVVFVDQRAKMPADGAHFSDVCHLTQHGIEVFAQNVMDAVRDDIDRWKSLSTKRAR